MRPEERFLIAGIVAVISLGTALSLLRFDFEFFAAVAALPTVVYGGWLVVGGAKASSVIARGAELPDWTWGWWTNDR